MYHTCIFSFLQLKKNSHDKTIIMLLQIPCYRNQFRVDFHEKRVEKNRQMQSAPEDKIKYLLFKGISSFRGRKRAL